MKRSIKFCNDWVGDWYAEIPEWDGPKSALQMVMGADTMLSILSEGKTCVTLFLSTENFLGSDILQLVREDGEIGGGHYILASYKGIPYNMNIWLCDVTKFVFGDLPKFLYFSVE